MPIHVENGLPAIDMLKMEGIRIHEMPQTQPCRWNVALVNLMPEKIPAEADILRLMARCPHETVYTYTGWLRTGRATPPGSIWNGSIPRMRILHSRKWTV